MNIEIIPLKNSAWYLIEGDIKGTLRINHKKTNLEERKMPSIEVRNFDGKVIGISTPTSPWNDNYLKKVAKYHSKNLFLL